jgi:hypothetical protein
MARHRFATASELLKSQTAGARAPWTAMRDSGSPKAGASRR